MIDPDSGTRVALAPKPGGGGGGALGPHFGRYMYVPQQSEKWGAPGATRS